MKYDVTDRELGFLFVGVYLGLILANLGSILGVF